MMDVLSENETLRGLTVVGISACTFLTLAYLVKTFGSPSHVLKSKDSAWKWKNIIVSFIHSTLTGLWAVLCFYHNPKMAEDVISTYTPLSHTLISVSVGYFIHDSCDMWRNNRTRQSLELILHHAVIISCFGIAVTTQQYIGYAVVALIVELNSIFLHSRQLMQMLGYAKDNAYYRLNSLVNLGTFITFRISTLAWLTRWIVVNRDNVPLGLFTVGSIGLAITTLMNIVLFYRLLRSDFISKKDHAKQK